MEERKRFFATDPLARHLEIELLEVTDGGARARMPVRDYHRNMFGMIHGGTIFALADHVFAASCNSHGQVAVALQVSISYLNAVKGKQLQAEAREISLNPKLGNYEITIRDEEGTLAAVFHGLAYRRRQKILFDRGEIVPL